MQFKLEDLPADTKPYIVLPWDHIKNMKSTPVLAKEGAQEAYRKIGWRLVATCLSDDGIGLAAPQVGLFKRVILVREFTKQEDGNYEFLPSFRLYINPEWNGQPEQGKSSLKEWCLSVPGRGFIIERFNSLEAKWQEFNSDELVDKSGLIDDFPARIYQHEYDHLVGISIPQRWDLQNKKTGVHKKPRKKKKRKKRR